MEKSLLIKNCRILNPSSEEIQEADIFVENGIIAEIGKIGGEASYGNVLDVEGRMVSPGFIDLHIQGAGGADVLDGKRESLEVISRTCARFGVASFLATTVFRPDEDNRHLRIASENVGDDLGGANLLGIHLEGPFISPAKRGMILPECICSPSLEVLQKILTHTKGKLRMMTIAPEIKGNLEIIRALIEEGIVGSFGHSSASYEETLRGIEAGLSHVTHLFNAMPSIHHRRPGPLLAIFETRRVSAQVISDGVHLHPAILKLAFSLLGQERCVIITDGMQAMGLPDGRYVYNGIEYESRDGAARYSDGTLIGTSLGLNQLVQRFIRFTGCSPNVGIKAVTQNPARVLGMEDRKGTIEVGKDADLTILDDDYSVRATIVGGKIVFRRKL